MKSEIFILLVVVMSIFLKETIWIVPPGFSHCPSLELEFIRAAGGGGRRGGLGR